MLGISCQPASWHQIALLVEAASLFFKDDLWKLIKQPTLTVKY